MRCYNFRTLKIKFLNETITYQSNKIAKLMLFTKSFIITRLILKLLFL